MNIENIEKARVLIAKRDTLETVLEKASEWKSAHFDLVEHCGSYPDRVTMTCFPELQERMLALISEEKENIEKELCKL